eukprot:12811943-Alexandrium_andersonii.AAC.1
MFTVPRSAPRCFARWGSFSRAGLSCGAQDAVSPCGWGTRNARGAFRRCAFAFAGCMGRTPRAGEQ